jgi:small subunit ribosomal protein S16
MSVKLRLQRKGRKNYAQYRVVASDVKRARDGQCIEVLGWYNPHGENDNKEKIDLDRVDYWTSVGAQMSPTVKQIVKRHKKTTQTA